MTTNKYKKDLLICKMETSFVASFDKDAEKAGKHSIFGESRMLCGMGVFEALRVRAGRMPWKATLPTLGGVKK